LGSPVFSPVFNPPGFTPVTGVPKPVNPVPYVTPLYPGYPPVNPENPPPKNPFNPPFYGGFPRVNGGPRNVLKNPG